LVPPILDIFPDAYPGGAQEYSNAPPNDWVTLAKDACSAGSIPKIDFQPPNPAGSGNSFPAAVLTAGSSTQQAYLKYVDADAAKLAKIPCPVLWAMFGEFNLGGYWNDISSGASSAQYAQLWQLTYNEIVNVDRVTNELFVYEPNGGVGNYTWGFPGAKYVDVIALDGFPIGTGDGATWSQLSGVCPGCPQFYGSTGFAQPGSVASFSGNNFTQVCNRITSTYPNIFGWVAWTQGAGLSTQNGAVQALSTPPWISAAQLPRFVIAGGNAQP
jgi:hypothetical protein